MKKAFTMIELLVVMVVGAILSAIAVSKIHTSDMASAVRDLISDIDYARILAMDNDTYDGNKDYYKNYYRLTITSKNPYKITNYESNTKGKLEPSEYARDFLDSDKRICDFDNNPICTPRAFALKNYTLDFKPTVALRERGPGEITPTNTIIFNELGEPLNYDYEPSGFKISVKKGSDEFCIYVEQNSGFAYAKKSACK